MAAACFAGLRYFAIIFTLAFAMGVARALVIAPRLGEMTAVLLEVPIIVGASWAVARHLLRDRHFTLVQRGTMGTAAFALLMCSEAILAVILRGQTISEWASELATPTGLIGLVGQLAFAVIPAFADLSV
ncbi:MAG: hypothetical protein M3O03_10135 [Pseudomonadota bacterium]|nr:hypothetical protein [Pseudomonadota bacterium]